VVLLVSAGFLGSPVLQVLAALLGSLVFLEQVVCQVLVVLQENLEYQVSAALLVTLVFLEQVVC
jgi:hypothetical protein